jgi:hypothetical protein
LSQANDTNTQIKPFLVCIEKLFNKLLQNLQKPCEITKTQSNCYIEIQKEPNVAPKISLKWLKSRPFECYNSDRLLEFIKNNDDIIQFDTNENLEKVYEQFKKTLCETPTHKLVIYLISSLTDATLSTYNELNCVEIVELVNNLLLKLIDANRLVLVAYCLIEIVVKQLSIEIDSIEFKRRTGGKTIVVGNKKLSTNLTFMSGLFAQRVEHLIAAIGRISGMVMAKSEIVIFNYLLCSLVHLLTKISIRKLAQFDALVDLEFSGSLEVLFKKCFKLGEASTNEICLKCLNVLYVLSLVPFNTLILNYSECNDDADEGGGEGCGGGAKESSYSNLEVLTNECRTAWKLKCIKKSFNLAKSLFSNEQLGGEDSEENEEADDGRENRKEVEVVGEVCARNG